MINTNSRRIVPWPCLVRQESLAWVKAGTGSMGILLFAFCLVGGLACGRCAFASTYYVAVTGDDKHPGTSDKPVRTIGRGAELAELDAIMVTLGAGGIYSAGVFLKSDINFMCPRALFTCFPKARFRMMFSSPAF